MSPRACRTDKVSTRPGVSLRQRPWAALPWGRGREGFWWVIGHWGQEPAGAGGSPLQRESSLEGAWSGGKLGASVWNGRLRALGFSAGERGAGWPPSWAPGRGPESRTSPSPSRTLRDRCPSLLKVDLNI